MFGLLLLCLRDCALLLLGPPLPPLEVASEKYHPHRCSCSSSCSSSLVLSSLLLRRPKVGPIVLDSAVGAEVDRLLATEDAAVFKGLIRRDTPGETARVRVEVGKEQVGDGFCFCFLSNHDFVL